MVERAPIWAGLTPEEHEYQYNPQKSVPNFAALRAQRDAPNAAARARLKSHLDIAFGEHALDTLDVFPAARDKAPVHVFIHGGYWRAQDKQNFAFLAEPLVARGICTVIINYALCPAVTLDGVVDSAQRGFEWVVRNIARFGGDPERISLSGHSAGAHLGSAIMATDWAARGIAADCLKAAVLISGIYDPSPAQHTSVNAEIRLTPEVIARHNYEKHPPRRLCPTWIIAGGREPWQFIDQSFRYAHHLRRCGGDPAVIVSPGFNHFDILDQYLDETSELMRAIIAASAAPSKTGAAS